MDSSDDGSRRSLRVRGSWHRSLDVEGPLPPSFTATCASRSLCRQQREALDRCGRMMRKPLERRVLGRESEDLRRASGVRQRLADLCDGGPPVIVRPTVVIATGRSARVDADTARRCERQATLDVPNKAKPVTAGRAPGKAAEWHQVWAMAAVFGVFVMVLAFALTLHLVPPETLPHQVFAKPVTAAR